jgi:hypothetical protein
MSTDNELKSCGLDEATIITWEPTMTMKPKLSNPYWIDAIRHGTDALDSELSRMFPCATIRDEPVSHVPKRVIYNGVTTIAIFPDGKKVIARPDKGAVFDKETGLAMCIAKHVYGTRAKFLKAITKANDQNAEVKGE